MTNTSGSRSCESCHRPIPRGLAVLRGDLRIVRAWHRDCYTVHRAVKDVPVEVLGGTLTERLELLRAGL